jgi:arsenate reductase
MAEGLLNTYYSDRYESYSAGIKPRKINIYAVKVMREVGIDISNRKSKSITEFRGMNFKYVVTVCDNAREVCPFFPGDKILHKNFEDPASFSGTPDEILSQTRRVRDKIRDWIQNTFGKTEDSN